MAFDKVWDYVKETPMNTNPVILKQLIDENSEGSTSGLEIIHTFDLSTTPHKIYKTGGYYYDGLDLNFDGIENYQGEMYSGTGVKTFFLVKINQYNWGVSIPKVLLKNGSYQDNIILYSTYNSYINCNWSTEDGSAPVYFWSQNSSYQGSTREEAIQKSYFSQNPDMEIYLVKCPE